MSAEEDQGNKEQICQSTADRISNLPPNVTQHILESLSLVNAVRTSILSRYWRYKWVSVSHLILDESFFPYVLFKFNNMLQHAKYLKVVNNVLLRHIGPIHKFYLYVPSENSISGAELSQWIECISAKGVKEFLLHDDRPSKKRLPSSLFTFLDLTHLSLIDCVLYTLPVTFGGFPNLVSLELHTKYREGRFIKAHTLELLVSSCPCLQKLSLILEELDDNPIICAPRLQSFVLRGEVSDFCFDGPTNITTLALYTAWDRKKEISQFLSSLPNLKNLVLGDSFWRIDQHDDFQLPGKLPNELSHLKLLQLVRVPLNCQLSISIVLWLINICPGLPQLCISGLNQESRCRQEFNIMENSQMFLSLKNIELSSISGYSSELQLIELLLLRSPVLEVMVIELNHIGGAEETKNVMKEMIRYRRASSSAEIILKTK